MITGDLRNAVFLWGFAVVAAVVIVVAVAVRWLWRRSARRQRW